MSKKRLGRGLDALLSERRKTTPADVTDAASDAAPAVAPAAQARAADVVVPEGPARDGNSRVAQVSEIVPSPYQPRRHFDETALEDLARSIARQGLLQPLVVRERASGGYELIAGERRWRAAQLAGLDALPVVVRVVTDEEASAFALIENMQREDLSALEEALGLARLRDEFELTQQQIADAVGKSRVAIANLLRLLNLGPVARNMLENGDIEMGHARALLAVEGRVQDQLAEQVADGGLSVRQTEELVRRAQQPQHPKSAAPGGKDPDTARLEQRLTDHLGAPVAIRHKNSGGGEVSIRYTSLEELEGVLRHLGYRQD